MMQRVLLYAPHVLCVCIAWRSTRHGNWPSHGKEKRTEMAQQPSEGRDRLLLLVTPQLTEPIYLDETTWKTN